uniref:Inorganic phosphate transporter n=1 Tax=Oryza sativa subsp. indica TaxID=39946 RepID=D0AB62_ORYSI|nr:inorganic phosphate transporter [Oryza sativa Indica Group]
MGRAASLVPQADYVWRIILMFGTVPAALTYYWRMKMPETARYTALIARNAKQAAADMSKVLHTQIEESADRAETVAVGGESWGLFSRQFLRRPGLRLLATTGRGFFLDIAFLQPEPVPKGHLQQGRGDPAGKNHEPPPRSSTQRPGPRGSSGFGETFPGIGFPRQITRNHGGGFRYPNRGLACLGGFNFRPSPSRTPWENTRGTPTGYIVYGGFPFFFRKFGEKKPTLYGGGRKNRGGLA